MVMDLLDRLAREATEPTARIAYGISPQQFGDLRLPSGEAASPWPVVMLIHGGYWRNRYDLAYFGAAASALTADGLATWNIEYRRIGDPGGAWPGAFLDVAAAADALRGLATDYALDLGRVVTLGHSAGGHLGLWLAARPRLPEDSPLWQANPLPIHGVVSLAGLADLRRASELHLSDDAATLLMGGTPEEAPERYASGSPYDLAPLGVTQALLHGTADTTVPFEISQRYAEHARSLGDDAELVTLDGAEHFGMVDPSTPEWQIVRARTLALAHR